MSDSGGGHGISPLSWLAHHRRTALVRPGARLLPLYEPIYGGGLLVISLTCALWLEAVDAYRFRLTCEASLQQMEQRLMMQREHYRQLSGQVRLVREAGHDLRHHIRVMRGFAEQGQWELRQKNRPRPSYEGLGLFF